MPGGWTGSNRNAELPANWRPVVRPAVLRRDGHACTWLEGYEDGGFAAYLAGDYSQADRCGERGADVDHVGDPHDHRPDNARTLCKWHHNRRSSKQGNAAQVRISTKRPREPHPGLISPK
jgi:hypothetical protein